METNESLLNSQTDLSSIEARENEVNKLEGELEKYRKELDIEKSQLNDLKLKILSEKENDIKDKKVEFSKLEKDISKKQEELNKIKIKLATEKAQFTSELDKYKTDETIKIDNELIQEINYNNQKLLDDYKKQIDILTNSISFSRDELNKSYEKLVSEFENVLKTKIELYDEKLSDVEKAKEVLSKEIAKSSNVLEKEAELNAAEKLLDAKNKTIDKIVDRLVNDKYSELNEELNEAKSKYEDLAKQYAIIKQQYVASINLIQNSEFVDKVKIKTDYESLSRNYQNLLKKYEEYSSEDMTEIIQKSKDYDNLQSSLKKLNYELNEANNKIQLMSNENNNVNSLQYQNEVLQNQIKVERDILTTLKDQIEDLESRINNKKVATIASESIETYVDEFHNKDINYTNPDENEWLDTIINKCEKSGYKFSKRLFYSFHTSLMSSDMSPLTVLAGVSGTGKSKLPQLYSRFGGLYFLSVPVQPDYDSPQSLFGYFNSIEKRFNATTLLRALVEFQKDRSHSDTKENIEDLSNGVLLVLLDEMNLAHIELYFSDLLSKLEERRDGNNDVGFEVDLGAGNKKYKVTLTDNVKWIGTMNEDETTKSLSDKVIDRGNIISFPRPTKFERYMDRRDKKIENESPMIRRSLWDNWINNKIRLNENELNTYMDIVVSINDAMSKANRAIGHRVWQSIEDYMISHPLVKKYANDENRRSIALKYAFEEAIVYKIMPKLRGIETDGIQMDDCLKPILKILQDNNLDSIIDDYKNALNSVTNTFYWNSSDYLTKDYVMDIENETE